jgi:pimeloyl-ACP methyl ester carboxylesterase
MPSAPTALAVLTIAVVAGAASASGEPLAGAVKGAKPKLHGCGNAVEPQGFRCGSIRVPFERSDPSYGTTRIGFAVRKRDQAGRPTLGTIFAQEGGPGYSSTGTANAYTKLFGKLLRRRDLVLVDMRGTGLSGPLDCTDLQQGVGPEFITLSQCARELGKRFISYRTSAGADDMDAVRDALGLRRITLYGDSYGTFFGQSYAYRHGERLKALVLDSAYPAKGESPWYGSLIRTGNRALELACRRSPRCSGDAGKRLRRLVAYLRSTGRTVESLMTAFGRAGTPETYVALDRAGAQLRRGNQKPWRRLTRPYKPTSGEAREYSRGEELAVSCNDYPMIWDKAASEPERRRQLERAIRAHRENFGPFTPREVALSASFSYLDCLTWPAPSAVYEPPISPGDEPTKAPVLVVSGEMDNLTTPQEGRWTARLFPRSRQYIARNAGHVDSLYFHDGAAARQIRRFLTNHTGG